MVSIIGLAHFLNAVVEIGAGAMFLTQPTALFPLAAGNAAFLEIISILAFGVLAIGM